ncbi:MAG: PEP/pyruvate-binding domain-containing protein [Candidatus Omnitrophica bacterium]|nr:PEP/pyruvate-binding domain-containing protein [Candidatus Omnitrophota bacterium]MBU4488827.1 PEP/pyruvate-binding domain-containing protein [Candidatus Omnitrophota bacterium]MCG2704717.1 PEP/pyruvate-binding domain-containing protein [Candidatus Omnitrophota bacterium]
MITTGLRGLDEVITGLRKGDNVVWQVEDMKDYADFVDPFVKSALRDNKKIIYMRFASHKPLLEAKDKVKIYKLNAKSGFETFTTNINGIITKEGRGAYYVFDCLSDLLPAWATDLMIGNFFMVTCPYLYELDTVTYFAILRDKHSFKTIARIRETTQLLIDVYRCEGASYVHPLKVWNRYTRTMFLPHTKDDDKFIPLTDSADAAKFLSHITAKKAEEAKRNLDYWDLLFLEAEELIRNNAPKEKKNKMFDLLSGIMVTRDKKIASLVKNNLTLENLLVLKTRLIGTGFIGGKAAGMLLARKMLLKDRSFDWAKISEEHDSFYIGADVFYTYIVQNGWWKLRMEQKTEEGYFEIARVLKDKMLFGKFPEELMEQFQQMIEYFGTSPIIVRSSSLLEDGFGNAFAGKYESIFCPNQGTPEERYIKFAEAVKRIYSSAMGEEALNYRLQRGLHKRDEQMALLVQRVSGSYHKNYFFPDIAGVGISYNTYVWNEKMDAKAGMVRLVAGLGTRAVNRVEGDYARIVALDQPLLRPYSDINDIRKFSQHEVDLIDVKENSFKSVSFLDLLSEKTGLRLDEIALKDEEITAQMAERGVEDKEYSILTFDNLVSKRSFITILKKILKILESNYKYPVDIEFTINFNKNSAKGARFKINLLQCRPLQTRGLGKKVDIPERIAADKVLFEAESHFLGGNISQPIKRLIYIKPEKYLELGQQDKYEIARIVGRLNKLIANKDQMPTVLLGPGRWGTSTPSLGVPVSFFEINKMSVLSEVAFEGGNLLPELSFGTHFFQDLVESNIFYVALFPREGKESFNKEMLEHSRNLLADLLPESSKYSGVVGVYDLSDKEMRLMADVVSQKAICFSDK